MAVKYVLRSVLGEFSAYQDVKCIAQHLNFTVLHVNSISWEIKFFLKRVEEGILLPGSLVHVLLPRATKVLVYPFRSLKGSMHFHYKTEQPVLCLFLGRHQFCIA